MNQVTISLETYEAMKDKIAYLEKQVEEKTIIKKVAPNWWQATLFVFGSAMVVTFFAYLSSKIPF